MERRGRLSSSGIARLVVFFLSSVFLRLDAAMGFRSLVPLSSRGTDAPPGLTVGHSGIFATPPGLLLSGKRSLSCSCISQVEVRMDGPSVSLYPRNTARGSDSFAPLVDGDGSSRRPLFCCSDKDEALQSVHEAPDGVSFASIGDTGLLTNALRRNTKTLAEWSSTLDIRWINLLGDNFYPHGVIGVDDPIWDDIFNIPFGFASLEKVAIFPVLGNHDYYTDPYAQIARYLRNATVPDVVAGVALASEASTFEGPISTFAGVDVVKLSQAHAVFPWIHLKKTNKGMKFLKNVDMRGVEGDRWRFPNYWYFTRHVFRNVPRHLSNPFKVNEKLDSVSPKRSVDAEQQKREEVTVVTIYLDSMILLAEEVEGSSSLAYKFNRDEVFTAQLDFVESVLKAAVQEADWIFICGHHPIVTDGTLKRNLPIFSQRLKDLIKKYHVDSYLSGHEHMLSFFQEPEMNDSTFIISGSGSKLAYRASCRRESCIYSRAESGFVVHLMSKKELHHAFVSADGVILFTKTQHAQDRTEIAAAVTSSGSDRGKTEEKADNLSPRYPLIKRVYVGPYDIASISTPSVLPAAAYFAFGVAVPLVVISCFFWIKKHVWSMLARNSSRVLV